MISLPDELLFSISSHSAKDYCNMLLTCKRIAAMDREDNKCHFVRRYNCYSRSYADRYEISSIKYVYDDYYDGRHGWEISLPRLPNGWRHSVNDLPCSGRRYLLVDGKGYKCNVGYWYKNNKLHRLCNPAIYGEMEGMLFTAWYKYGKLHRNDGPAVTITVSKTACRDIVDKLLRILKHGKHVAEHILDILHEDISGIEAYYEEGKRVHLIKYDLEGVPHDIPIKYVLPQMALVIDNNENELFIKSTLKELPKPVVYNTCEELPGNYSKPSFATYIDNQELTYEEDELLYAKYDTTTDEALRQNPYRYTTNVVSTK